MTPCIGQLFWVPRRWGCALSTSPLHEVPGFRNSRESTVIVLPLLTEGRWDILGSVTESET